jgi:hypothetical protein
MNSESELKITGLWMLDAESRMTADGCRMNGAAEISVISWKAWAHRLALTSDILTLRHPLPLPNVNRRDPEREMAPTDIAESSGTQSIREFIRGRKVVD